MSDFTSPLRDISHLDPDTSIAIVSSDFNTQMVDDLVAKNKEFLTEQGMTTISEFRVPGALEIPNMVARLLTIGGYDMVLCLGVVLRWETTHYDTVAEQSATWLMQLSLDTDVVIINGILTCETQDQAIARTTHQYALSGLNYLAELTEKGVLQTS